MGAALLGALGDALPGQDPLLLAAVSLALVLLLGAALVWASGAVRTPADPVGGQSAVAPAAAKVRPSDAEQAPAPAPAEVATLRQQASMKLLGKTKSAKSLAKEMR